MDVPLFAGVDGLLLVAVANEVPNPVALASTSAQGRIPLVAVAAAPV